MARLWRQTYGLLDSRMSGRYRPPALPRSRLTAVTLFLLSLSVIRSADRAVKVVVIGAGSADCTESHRELPSSNSPSPASLMSISVRLSKPIRAF